MWKGEVVDLSLPLVWGFFYPLLLLAYNDMLRSTPEHIPGQLVPMCCPNVDSPST